MKISDVTKIIFVLIIIALGLIILNLTERLTLRHTDIIGDINSANVSNQIVRLRFSRPIPKNDYTQMITVDPVANFAVQWEGNNLIIKFTDNLHQDTHYKITLSGEIKDIFGSTLGNDYEFKFKTEKILITYIQKSKTGKDKIVATDLSLKNSVDIVEESGIKMYAANKNYLAYVHETEVGAPKITVMNLNTKSKITKEFPNTRISKIVFSPTNDEFVFASQDVTVVEGYYVSGSDYKIELYTISDNTIKHISPKNVTNDVLDMNYSKDGTAIVYRGMDAIYYLVSLADLDSVVPLGKHTAAFGFSRDSSKINFIDYDPTAEISAESYINIYFSEGDNKIIADKTKSILDPQFFNNSDRIIFSIKYKEEEMTRGLFKIAQHEIEGTQIQDILQMDNASIENPKLSPDDRYLIAEIYDISDLKNFSTQREFVFHTKPSTGGLIIYDLVENKLVGSINEGFDAYWIY